jgi:hypothetical protein
MDFSQSHQPDDRAASDGLPRPKVLRPADRHILVGVSHASNDPALHRSFEIRATYDASTHGWIAQVGEQNLNEQRGDWTPLTDDDRLSSFPTAAACLGHAVAALVATFDQDEDANA